MVHTDLDSLKETWYNLACNAKNAYGDTPEQKHLFKCLDAWQRKELMNAYMKGMADSIGFN